MNRREAAGTKRSLVMLRRGETYVFTFPDTAAGRVEVVRQFARFAVNEELSFTFYDAAMCAQRVRKMGLFKEV